MIKIFMQYIIDNKFKALIYLLTLVIGIVGICFFTDWLSNSANIYLITKFVSLELLMGIMILFWCIALFGVSYVFAVTKVNKVKFIFCVFMLLGIMGMLVAGFVSHGEAIRSMLFTNKQDIFMDYFNSIQYGLEPYSKQVIYPPLINIVYALLGHFNMDVQAATENRMTQTGMIIFTFYNILVYGGLIWVIMKIKNGSSYEKAGSIILALLSLPFIYAFERGNSIILSLVFTLCFLRYYESENNKIKYISFLCLAIAASIKISPAIFGMLLVKERRYKDACICACIGVAVFMVPFLFTDGNIFILLNNISSTTEAFQGTFIDDSGNKVLMGQGMYVNLLNTSKFLGRLFNSNYINAAVIGNMGLFLLGLLGIIMNNTLEKWKTVGILSGLIVLCTGFSAIYNLTYLLIPALFFFNKERYEKMDYIYVFLFLGICIPFVNVKLGIFNIFFSDIYPMRISTFIESISLLVFMILLVVETYISFFVDNKGVSVACRKGYLFVTLLIVIGVPAYTYGYKAKQPVMAFYPSNGEIANAGSGLLLTNGMYGKVDLDAQLYLKTDTIAEYGLNVYLKYNTDSTLNEVELKINGITLNPIKKNVDGKCILFVSPRMLKESGISLDDAGMYLDIHTGDHNYEVLYAGPAKGLDELNENVYKDETTVGFTEEKGKLWMGKEAAILINAEDAQYDGITISGDVQPRWNDGGISGPLLMTISSTKGTVIKELPKAGHFIINLLPEEIVPEECYFSDSPFILSMEVNKTFNSHKLLLEGSDAEKGVMIQSVASTKSVDEYEPGEENISDLSTGFWLDGDDCWLGHNGTLTLNSTSYKDKGMYIEYLVPYNLVHANMDKNIVLNVYINGALVKQQPIDKWYILRDNLQGTFIPMEVFQNLGHWVEIQLTLNATFNKSMMLSDSQNIHDLGVVIKYIGSQAFLTSVTEDDFFTSSTEDTTGQEIYSQGIELDDRINQLTMGYNMECLFDSQAINNEGLLFEYSVNPLLFEANKGKNLNFTIFVNGQQVKTVSILKAGDDMAYITPEEIQPFLNEGNKWVNIFILSSQVYNEKKMCIRNYDVDTSLQIRYLGVGK
jgi:hypothetical protein